MTLSETRKIQLLLSSGWTRLPHVPDHRWQFFRNSKEQYVADTVDNAFTIRQMLLADFEARYRSATDSEWTCPVCDYTNCLLKVSCIACSTLEIRGLRFNEDGLPENKPMEIA